ncbi:MAG: S-layer homology domain-containing protein [Thermoleophilia bacterium]|nr:S-layer homology domain-containing protein [Thermoleophilia bacterium]
MHKRGHKVALVAVLTIILVLGIAGVAFAQWNDLTLSILGDYGITEAQVAQISDGYTDGTWKPYANMPRKQFVKMAVDAYQIPLVNPATPTYTDVPASHDYYQYIEAATAAGLTNGVGGGLFDPEATITREQAAAIIVRWVAAKNGYDLDTFYTDAEAAAILASFPDAAQVGPSLVKEMAFAVDFGIVWGDASGMLAPKKTLTRIQGAAMLIRSWSIIPPPGEPVVPAKIELLSDDEAENLIGLTHQYTYKVTQADGSAAPGVLVDFDTLLAPWYVGNIQPAAALTNANGEVTVNLISTEVGIERVSAAVNGVSAIWSTKYWLALDEVYILDEELSAQNNAGVPHTWAARVLVFGPGPLSTSQSDWYNLIDPDGDPAQPLPDDGVDAGVDYNVDYSQYADELDWRADGYVERTMAGIPVYWSIDDWTGNTEGAATITEATENGDIAADGQSAWASTDADGMSSVTIASDETGTAEVSALADYAGNPYEGLLFEHSTNSDYEDHTYDWDPQPTDYAVAYKTWIPHVIGAGDSPIDPAYQYANIGEEFILTITLVDSFGNVIPGRQVEWFMQGIGHFVTDDDNTITDPTDPAGNKDLDVTDVNGQARVMVKSLEPGEQIVHAKVRDKGINGMEGQFITYDAEVQWFDVDVATFDDPTTYGEYDDLDTNEAWAENTVGTTHDFTLHVYGLKLEMDPSVDFPQQQTPYIDSDAAGHSYDGIFDWRDADYFGGILLVNDSERKASVNNNWPHDEDGNGIIDPDEAGTYVVNVQGRDIIISGVGGYTSFDWDMDGYKEPFDGETGIYLPLEGKDVTFALVDNYIGLYFDEDGLVESVGSFTPDSAVTDENGEAVVTVSSNQKGPETVEATVDWEGNPHNMSELVKAYAKKIWVASTAEKIVVTIDGEVVADNQSGEIATPINPLYDAEGNLNSAHIEVHVYDEFGNDLPDYEVVYLLENLGTTLQGKQDADDTYLPRAYFTDLDTTNTISGKDYDMNGDLPDHNEPTPESDPYAIIVGDGGTDAFFFNQWLGAGYISPGAAWWTNSKNAGEGNQPDGYVSMPPKSGTYFYGYYDAQEVGLLTDGAKAWTLDGFFAPDWGEGEVWPNLYTGSHIDVQLAEDPAGMAPHLKSIIKIMVYAPADGLVTDAAPLWHYQVHKVWEAPVPTTITLSPATDISVAGLEAQTVTAKVLDQFGDPVVGIPVELFGTTLEGTQTTQPDGVPATFEAPTDATGQVNFTWTQASGDWGVQSVKANTVDLVNPVITSNASVIQWVYMDGTSTLGDGIAADGNLLEAIAGQSKVTVFGSWVSDKWYQGWAGKTLEAYLIPGGSLLGSVVYDATIDTSITTTHTWVDGEAFYVKAPASTNSDEIANWVYDTAYTPIVIE